MLQHLQMLEASGLVRSEKTGRVRTCRMEPEVLKTAEGWIAEQRTLWERRLDRLEDYLDNSSQGEDEWLTITIWC